MDNNVVIALQDALADGGWGAMRFNFRGVGRSSGKYGDGEGEVQDLMAVAAYLKEQGKEVLHIAGYSFGAWITLKATAQGLDPASVILVSPPLDFLDFSSLTLPSKPCLISLGDRDTFCSMQSLRNWLTLQQPDSANVRPLTAPLTLPGCDHFYWGQERVLAAKVLELLHQHFQPPV